VFTNTQLNPFKNKKMEMRTWKYYYTRSMAEYRNIRATAEVYPEDLNCAVLLALMGKIPSYRGMEILFFYLSNNLPDKAKLPGNLSRHVIRFKGQFKSENAAYQMALKKQPIIHYKKAV
jgi:hypothetical protein